MKATGIVRRIDNLGRIVLPKEIRRSMRIREGDPLEIYTEEDGTVVLKKYSTLGDLQGLAQKCANAMNRASNNQIVITDREHVIALSGKEKWKLGRHLSGEFTQILEKRGVTKENSKKISITEDKEREGAYNKVICPIVCEGDIIGGVVVETDESRQLTEADERMATVAAGFLGKQIEL